MKPASQGKMCGILIYGQEGSENAVPWTSIWALAAKGQDATLFTMNDATSTGSTGDYGRISESRRSFVVALPLPEAIQAFRRASRGDIVDVSEKALNASKAGKRLALTAE